MQLLHSAFGSLRDRIHALRVIARGTLFEVAGWQTGDVFQRVGSLRRSLDKLGLAVAQVDETDRGAPILVARREPVV